MNINEYNNVKDMTYLEYCDYLQNKYGLPPRPYCSPDFEKYRENSCTAYGLVIHHKMEDHAILLSTLDYMKKYPYEWQCRENLVYCDFLEHLLLHVLITEYPAEDRVDKHVGGGGIGLIYDNIISFFKLSTGVNPGNKHLINSTMLNWQQNCFSVIKGDFDVLYTLCERITKPHNLTSKSFFGAVVDLSESDLFNSIIISYQSEFASIDSMKYQNIMRYNQYKTLDND